MKRKFKQLQEKFKKQYVKDTIYSETLELKSIKYLLLLIFSYETHGTIAPEWLTSTDMHDDHQTKADYIKSQLLYLYRRNRAIWKYKYAQKKQNDRFTEWILEKPADCLTAARFMYPEIQGNLLKNCVAVNVVNPYPSIIVKKYSSIILFDNKKLKQYVESPDEILQQIMAQRNITKEEAQDTILAMVLSEAEEFKRDKIKFGALSKLEKEIYEDVKGFLECMKKKAEPEKIPARILLDTELANVIKKGAEILGRRCVICSITDKGFIVKKSDGLNVAIQKLNERIKEDYKFVKFESKEFTDIVDTSKLLPIQYVREDFNNNLTHKPPMSWDEIRPDASVKFDSYEEWLI